jgi:LacI family transcriptional regulator
MLRGILNYVRLYGPWALHLDSGGANDQRMPDLTAWRGSGIIARIPNPRVAADIVAAHLPTVLIDPVDTYLDPSLSALRLQPCDLRFVRRRPPRGGLLPRQRICALRLRRRTLRHELVALAAGGLRFAAGRADYACAVYTPPSPAECAEWEVERRRMCRWLKKLPKPLAVFAANDARGRQVLNACLAADLPVPYEVAVLAVNNDVMICETSLPPLSSVAVDMERAGYVAAELLDQLMRKTVREQTCVMFEPQDVVARASTQRLQVNDRLVIPRWSSSASTRG